MKTRFVTQVVTSRCTNGKELDRVIYLECLCRVYSREITNYEVKVESCLVVTQLECWRAKSSSLTVLILWISSGELFELRSDLELVFRGIVLKSICTMIGTSVDNMSRLKY